MHKKSSLNEFVDIVETAPAEAVEGVKGEAKDHFEMFQYELDQCVFAMVGKGLAKKKHQELFKKKL